jgi:hypothetical protein
MRVALIGCATLAVVLLAGCGGRAPAHVVVAPLQSTYGASPAAVRCAKQMIDERFRLGRVNGRYALPCYGAALGLLPVDRPPPPGLVEAIDRAYAARVGGPRWLAAAETKTLDRSFGGARPIRTVELWYPRKVAVVFEFASGVACGPCSGPTAGDVPRGRMIRMSFDRRTHLPGDAIRICEARGSWPPRAACLRR